MPELPHLLRTTRDLIEAFQEGDKESFKAFREFISFLLHQTIAKQTANIQLYYSGADPKTAFVGSPKRESPIPLNNGKFLRVMFQLALDPKKKLTVIESNFQYQIEPEKSSRWIFRYDYSRNPSNDYPASHLQINAKLREADAVHRDCPDIHFSVNRISLEAVIRLLVEQFNVKCNEPKHWRKILALSERSFNEGAFRPLSGPE